MTIGDIIIIPTQPPHIGSVVSETEAMCEDGVTRPYPKDAAVAYTALEFIKEVEKEVLKRASG